VFDVNGAFSGMNAVATTGTNGNRYAPDFRYSDASNRLGRPALNYMANPNGRGGLRGYGTVGSSAADGTIAAAEETTITRDGVSSLRITVAGATTAGTYFMRARPYGQADLIADNTILAWSGWFYLEDVGVYNAATEGPQFGILKSGSSQIVTKTWLGTTILHATPAVWTPFFGWVDIGTSVTSIDFIIYPFGSSTALGGTTHNIYISDLCLTPNPQSFQDVRAGRWQPASQAGQISNGAFIGYDTTVPGASSGAWAVGDTIHDSSPAASTVAGWRCTTPGTGTVAKWSPMAALGAELA